MTILYLDTSSSYIYAGIVSHNSLIEECQIKLDKDLSSFSLPEIEKLFNKSNLNPSDIDKIIVVTGPGSFTGVRIGVTIAKTYAWALKKDITTISSLQAMALSVDGYDYVVPVIDARHECVFGAIYDGNGQVILEDQYLKLAELKASVGQTDGQGCYITNDDLPLDKTVEQYHPNILKIVSYFQDKEAINPHAIVPNYLKKTEAEESKEHDRTDC